MAVKTDTKLSMMSYVIVYVQDTKKSVPFYRDILGMTVKSEEEGWVELETGNTTLALHGMKPGEKHAGKFEGQPIVVFTVDNVHEARAELLKKGVNFKNECEVVCEAGDHVGMSTNFYDVDGNLYSIFSMVKK
ncbi:MAG: VOC family protein [Candidatus Melainabacteria bacterium]|nr:VOC family protein [Candidatus Melainabacteria bacterium]